MFGMTLGMLASAGQASIIKSIQQISVTIASGNTTGTTTISSVTTTNCMLIWDGWNSNSSFGSSVEYGDATINTRIALTNGTTVTATRDNSSTSTVTVYCTVVEFIAGVVTNQRTGTIAVTSSINTATISAVNTSRSVCLFLGYSITGARTDDRANLMTVELTDSTTVTAQMGFNPSDGQTSTLSYMVVEFSATYVNSVQQSTLTHAGGSSATATITSVNVNNAIVLFGGWRIGPGSTDVSGSIGRISLTSSTQLTATYGGGASTNIYMVATVLEFKPNIIRSLQKGTTTLVSATSADTTISSVDTTKTLANWRGYSFDSSGTGTFVFSYGYVGIKIQSATAIRSLVNTSSANTIVTSWEVVEFN